MTEENNHSSTDQDQSSSIQGSQQEKNIAGTEDTKDDTDSQNDDTNSSQNKAGDKDKPKQNFKPGQVLNMVRVRFPGHNKSYPFNIGNRSFRYGEQVVAMSDRGVAVGYINSFPYKLTYKENMGIIRSIHRSAAQDDVDQQIANYKKEKQTETVCNRLIEKHNLDMNLTHVEFTQFGKKAVFYFTAPARVDFRQLVRDLIGELKIRIELRQISVRDRAAAVGGIGPCGRQLCCSSFLNRYGHVNVKMAKNQDLTLNFSKLNGVCGQLKCCLSYEDEVYSQKRRELPHEGELIFTHTGERGKVTKVFVLSQVFTMLTENGVRKKFTLSQYKGKASKDFEMPREFDYITDETHTLIGEETDQLNYKEEIQDAIDKAKEEDSNYANEIFEEHFEMESFELQ